ncbi:MAG: hypothetical protein WBA22_08400 [Candidatus Methanofastidiosia archaeon]
MLLLRNDPVWNDMKSSILYMENFLQKLNEEKTTGFLELEFPDGSAVMLLDQGEIILCARYSGTGTYPVAQAEILHQLKAQQAVIGCYRLKKEIVHINYHICTGELLFKDTNSENMDIKKLLVQLEDNAFTGVVTIASEEGFCYILLEKGSPEYCVCQRRNELIDSAECVEWFLSLSSKKLLVRVYGGQEPRLIVRLKDVVTEVLGEPVEKIVSMLEESGSDKQELLKAISEIEKITYLFFDKKKAKILSQRLREVIEEEPS